MRPRDAWRAAFPKKENSAVVGFMIETFRALADRKLATFRYSLNEPDITETLGMRLADTAKQNGFTGQWGYEMPQGRLDPETLKKTQRRRTDIRYFSNDPAAPLNLTFEFKKLNDGSYSRSHYSGEGGIGRFVYAGYGKDSPCGYMVALMEYDDKAAITKLKTALCGADLCRYLKMVAEPHPLREPSVVCAEHALFDTVHARVGGAFVNIDIGHIALHFTPGPPPAVPKGAKGRVKLPSGHSLQP